MKYNLSVLLFRLIHFDHVYNIITDMKVVMFSCHQYVDFSFEFHQRCYTLITALQRNKLVRTTCLLFHWSGILSLYEYHATKIYTFLRILKMCCKFDWHLISHVCGQQFDIPIMYKMCFDQISIISVSITSTIYEFFLFNILKIVHTCSFRQYIYCSS